MQGGVVRFSPDGAWAAALARDSKDRLHLPCSLFLLHTMDGDTHAGPEQEHWMRELQKLRGCNTVTLTVKPLSVTGAEQGHASANGKRQAPT